MALPRVTNLAEKRSRRGTLERSRGRWLAVFFFCAISGVAMCGAGLMLSALGSLRFFETSIFLDRMDTALIAAAFPVVVFAAHGLDKAEEARKKLKAISRLTQK